MRRRRLEGVLVLAIALALPARNARAGLVDCFADEVVRFEGGYTPASAGQRVAELPGIVIGPPGDSFPVTGSVSTVSLGHNGWILLSFDDNRIVDGPGPDFIVFENAFFKSFVPTDPNQPYTVFAEPASVAVSDDGVTFHQFPYDPSALAQVGQDATASAALPALHGLAGITPTFTGDWTVPDDPGVWDPNGTGGVSGAGGDAFDLADVGLSGARYILIIDLGLATGFAGPAEGFDLDAVVALHAVPVAAGADGDGDGLPDADETIWYGTDPALADTDGDSIPDGEGDRPLPRSPLISGRPLVRPRGRPDGRTGRRHHRHSAHFQLRLVDGLIRRRQWPARPEPGAAAGRRGLHRGQLAEPDQRRPSRSDHPAAGTRAVLSRPCQGGYRVRPIERRDAASVLHGRLPAMRRGTLPALLLLLAAPAAAATEPAETVRVEGKAEKALTDQTVFATTIRASDFDSRITTLADLLEETAGVRVRSWGGLGAFSTVSIRGSTAEQVSVYVDGVLLNTALGGGVNLADLQLESVEAIDVYRGFTPAWLPSAGIGGAINIRTRGAGSSHPAATGSIGYGSYDTARAAASASWTGTPGGREADGIVTFEGVGSSGDFRFYDNNGTPYDAGDDGYRTRINNRFRAGNLTGRAGFATSGSGRVDLQTGVTLRRQGVPGIDAFQSETARFDSSRALFKAGWSNDRLASGKLRLDLDARYTRTAQDFRDRAGDTTGGVSVDTRNILDSVGPSVLLRWRPSASAAGRHQMTLLVSALRESAVRRDALNPEPDRGTATRLTWDAALEDEIQMAGGRFLLSPSVRWTRYASRFDAPAGVTLPPAADDAEARASGRLGAAWRPIPSVSVRANAGRFYRVPSFIEMFGDQGSVKGSAGLEPETGWNYDLGMTYDPPGGSVFRRVHLQAALFRSDADNLIQFVQTSQSQVTAQNTGRVRVTGLELSAAFRCLSWLDGSVDYTWQVAEDRSDTYRYGSDLPGRPRHEVSARASVTRDWGRPFYQFSYIGPNYLDTAAAAVAGGSHLSPEQLRLPGRYIHGAGFTRRAGRRTEMTVEVDNVFNVKTVDVARFPLPGRMVQARVKVSFR